MAMLAEVVFSTRQECLEGFAKTMGVHPPREPIPVWWEAFEKWYCEMRAKDDFRSEDDPDKTGITVRLEAMDYDDEDGDDSCVPWDEGDGPLDDDDD
jgi:hypothetical protein